MSRRSSPLDSEQCRHCTSFSDYVKSTRKKLSTSTTTGENDSQDDQSRRSDCPLDRDELGNKSWGLLHTIAANYPEKPSKGEESQMRDFFKIFSHLYPCEYCAEDFRKELKQSPPATQSQEALAQWLCKMHNKVNVKIGKPTFDCSKVNERWRDGWADGSCD